MLQLIGAAFCLAIGIYVGTGDPFVGLLAAVCAVIWVATIPMALRLARRPPVLIRME